MIIRRPEYYDRFRCLAGLCPDSCCQDWEVTVDDAAAERYRALSGSLGDDLREKLVFEEGAWSLKITDGRCPMWQRDGLCRIQCELGEGGLCQVCRDFPRLRHDYGSFVELGLELSCPEAARLILNAEPAKPLTTTVPEDGEAEYDTEAMEVLLRTREQALKILSTGTVEQALTMLLLYGYRAQEELDWGEPASWDGEKALAFAQTIAAHSSPQPLIQLYSQLDILTDRWRQRLAQPNPAPQWASQLRAMARYGVERHWLQAVSDYDLACRVKMIVSGCVLVHYLGGDPVATAQLWSKEIENSADNLDSLLDAAYSSPLMTDALLLGLLQNSHFQSNPR